MGVSEQYTAEVSRNPSGTLTCSTTMGKRTYSPLTCISDMDSSVTNMFAMTDSKPHSIQKRMVSNVYSKSHLQSSPDLHKLSQILLFDRFLPILAAAASEQLPIDILELNFAATMDSMNAYIFGLSNGTDFLRDVDSRQHFLRRWHYRAPHKFWPQELPGITSLLAKIGIRMVPRSVDTANQEVEDWCLRMCKLAEKSSEEVATKRPPEETAYTPPVVYKQLSQSMTTASRKSSTSDSSSQGQDLFVASEILDQNIAGFETSGITLTYLYHELSQRPLLQSSLRTELLSLSPPVIHPSTSHALPSPRSIDALPLLHAILMETLRLHGAIPGPQPRVTPSTPTSLAGSKPLPGGVRVSAQPYSLHRNAEVFPDPESWIPERWLEADKERKDEMMRWFWAFGSGGRMCIGSNFAMQGTYEPFIPLPL